MNSKTISLRPNWNLLDSTFESYKLSLQQLPVYSIDPGCKADTVTLSDNEFSYIRTKTLSLHNYLFGDPWNESRCYFVDNSGHIRCISIVIETSIKPPDSVFQLGSHFLQTERHTPVTISFPSPSLCLVSDGAGLIYLLETGDRQNNDGGNIKWKALLNEGIIGDSGSPTIILHSVHRSKSTPNPASGDQNENNAIDILSLRFEDEKNGDSMHTFAIIEWISLKLPSSNSKYEVLSHKTFKSKQVPFYCAIGENGNELFIGSQSSLKFVPDWDQQVMDEEIDMEREPDVSDSAETSAEPLYKWDQTDEDVTVLISMPEYADKTSVVYNISKHDIRIGFKNASGKEDIILEGKLFVEIDEQSSNWSINNKVLEITIQKQLECQTWPCVVLGDTGGQMLNGNDKEDVEMQSGDTRSFQPTGLDHYEMCDDLPDVDSVLYRFDPTTNKYTHEASVASNQWLFNCYYQKKKCCVLRHDVDALLWESITPDELNPTPWTHAATFNALGYVKASKEDVKYCGCSPNASYAALCESSRRVFVYHSPTTSAAPLRNRTTGKQMHISKQQVVTLPSNDQIIGFHTTSELMFVLTEQEIFIVKVNTPDT